MLGPLAALVAWGCTAGIYALLRRREAQLREAREEALYYRERWQAAEGYAEDGWHNAVQSKRALRHLQLENDRLVRALERALADREMRLH